MIALAVLAAAAAASGNGAPPVANLLLARPIETFGCRLYDVNGDAYPFAFRVTGGQGIVSGGRLQAWTPRRVEVIEDPKDLATNYPEQHQERAGIDRGEGEQSLGWIENGNFRRGLHIEARKVGNGDVSVAVYGGFADKFSAIGLCEHSSVDQTPIEKESNGQ